MRRLRAPRSVKSSPIWPSGWGALTVTHNPDLLWHGYKKWPKPGTKSDSPNNTPTAIIETLITMASRLGHTIVGAAIEDQYLSVNPDSMKKLSRNGGRWEEAFRSKGIPVVWVNTQTWQTRELGTCRIASKEVKRRCMAKARGLWNKNLKSDEADAAIIGRFYAVRLAFDKLNWVRSARRTTR